MIESAYCHLPPCIPIEIPPENTFEKATEVIHKKDGAISLADLCDFSLQHGKRPAIFFGSWIRRHMQVAKTKSPKDIDIILFYREITLHSLQEQLKASCPQGNDADLLNELLIEYPLVELSLRLHLLSKAHPKGILPQAFTAEMKNIDAYFKSTARPILIQTHGESVVQIAMEIGEKKIDLTFRLTNNNRGLGLDSVHAACAEWDGHQLSPVLFPLIDTDTVVSEDNYKSSLITRSFTIASADFLQNHLNPSNPNTPKHLCHWITLLSKNFHCDDHIAMLTCFLWQISRCISAKVHSAQHSFEEIFIELMQQHLSKEGLHTLFIALIWLNHHKTRALNYGTRHPYIDLSPIFTQVYQTSLLQKLFTCHPLRYFTWIHHALIHYVDPGELPSFLQKVKEPTDLCRSYLAAPNMPLTCDFDPPEDIAHKSLPPSSTPQSLALIQRHFMTSLDVKWVVALGKYLPALPLEQRTLLISEWMQAFPRQMHSAAYLTWQSLYETIQPTCPSLNAAKALFAIRKSNSQQVVTQRKDVVVEWSQETNHWNYWATIFRECASLRALATRQLQEFPTYKGIFDLPLALKSTDLSILCFAELYWLNNRHLTLTFTELSGAANAWSHETLDLIFKETSTLLTKSIPKESAALWKHLLAIQQWERFSQNSRITWIEQVIEHWLQKNIVRQDALKALVQSISEEFADLFAHMLPHLQTNEEKCRQLRAELIGRFPTKKWHAIDSSLWRQSIDDLANSKESGTSIIMRCRELRQQVPSTCSDLVNELDVIEALHQGISSCGQLELGRLQNLPLTQPYQIRYLLQLAHQALKLTDALPSEVQSALQLVPSQSGNHLGLQVDECMALESLRCIIDKNDLVTFAQKWKKAPSNTLTQDLVTQLIDLSIQQISTQTTRPHLLALESLLSNYLEELFDRKEPAAWLIHAHTCIVRQNLSFDQTFPRFLSFLTQFCKCVQKHHQNTDYCLAYWQWVRQQDGKGFQIHQILFDKFLLMNPNPCTLQFEKEYFHWGVNGLNNCHTQSPAISIQYWWAYFYNITRRPGKDSSLKPFVHAQKSDQTWEYFARIAQAGKTWKVDPLVDIAKELFYEMSALSVSDEKLMEDINAYMSVILPLLQPLATRMPTNRNVRSIKALIVVIKDHLTSAAQPDPLHIEYIQSFCLTLLPFYIESDEDLSLRRLNGNAPKCWTILLEILLICGTKLPPAKALAAKEETIDVMIHQLVINQTLNAILAAQESQDKDILICKTFCKIYGSEGWKEVLKMAFKKITELRTTTETPTVTEPHSEVLFAGLVYKITTLTFSLNIVQEDASLYTHLKELTEPLVQRDFIIYSKDARSRFFPSLIRYMRLLLNNPPPIDRRALILFIESLCIPYFKKYCEVIHKQGPIIHRQNDPTTAYLIEPMRQILHCATDDLPKESPITAIIFRTLLKTFFGDHQDSFCMMPWITLFLQKAASIIITNVTLSKEILTYFEDENPLHIPKKSHFLEELEKRIITNEAIDPVFRAIIFNLYQRLMSKCAC